MLLHIPFLVFLHLAAGSSPPRVSTTRFTNSRWVLRHRPTDKFRTTDLKLEEVDENATTLEDGEVIVQVLTLSIEAFYRTTLDAEAYHGSVGIGDVVPALGIGVVVASKSKTLKKGALVTGMLGAQTMARQKAATLQPVAVLPGTKRIDCLGRMGISGLTAWIGMRSVLGPPKRGEVVVVSSAAGGVGSLAAQIAKASGATVIGVTGGPAKCKYLVDRLKLDGAIDYKDQSRSLTEQLDELAPEGIDFFFDNAGGAILDAVLSRLSLHARIVLCGGISHYASGDQNKGCVVGPSAYLKLAERSSTMRGFNVMHYLPAKLPAFLVKMLWLVWRRKVILDEHYEYGIERFAAAMELMQSGRHIGKLMVNVHDKAPR